MSKSTTSSRKRAPTSDGRSSARRGTARERLLDAAGTLFAERGYHAASVDEIVAAAGVTKGALYGHFASKQDLFVGLLEERIEQPVRALIELTSTTPGDTPTAASVGAGFAALVDDQREAVLLIFEFWALGVRDPSIRQRYAQWLGSLTDALAQALTARHEATGVPLHTDAGDVAAAIVALAHGLAMQELATPAAGRAQLLTPMLDLLYGGLVRQAAGD
jgi:AcrR family transcriptional regulator